jgi:hypothetical protein
MSQERRNRQKERQGIPASSQNWGRIAIFAVLIVAAIGVVFYLNHRTDHKHDAFARCLKDRGVKMYGAYWCPHCQEQKEKFGASALEDYGPYIECGIKGDLHGVAQVCKDEGIKHYPTWQFPPTGERVERIFSLEELSDRTGCALP